MKLIEFLEQNIVIAKDQPQYIPMPAYKCNDLQGRIVCCWSLSLMERFKLLFSGKIWHHILTYDRPIQPQLLDIKYPFAIEHEKNKVFSTKLMPS